MTGTPSPVPPHSRGTPAEPAGAAASRGRTMHTGGTSRERLAAAAPRARRAYPGPVGELMHREILAYRDLGYRFDGSGLIPRLVDEVLAPGDAAVPDGSCGGMRIRPGPLHQVRAWGRGAIGADGALAARLTRVAERALVTHPGPVGELVRREILAHRDFGCGVDGANLLAQVVREVGTEARPARWPGRNPRRSGSTRSGTGSTVGLGAPWTRT